MTAPALALFTGGQLLAAAVAAPDTADDRIREGLLVPWDEDGRTNLGKGFPVRRVFADRLEAEAKVVGIYGHNRESAVSRLLSWENRPEGLWGRIFVNRTALGDQLLAEIDGGARDGLSIEAGDLEFDAAGGIVGGTLDFVAHVPVGAYSSARVHLAATVNDPTGELVTQPAPTAPAAPAITPDQFQELLAAVVSRQAGATDGPSAAQLLGTGNAPGAPGQVLTAVDPVQEAAELAARLHQSGGTDQTLYAALADITASGLPLFQSGQNRLGEKLWEGAGYSRQFVSLMRSKPLTAMRYYGWQWTKRPVVAAWSGNKTEVPSDTVALEQVPFDARRCAGGWDVDRKYKDFGDSEFWAEFYAAQTESYQELSDTWAAEAIVTAALDVSDDANLSTLPADYLALVDATGVEAGPTQLIRAAAIGRVILEGTPRVKQGPDYILVNPIDWLTLADLTALDLPAFLALLKVDPANFIPTIQVPQGQVIMGARNAMTFRELGGGAPIRVEALDVARGGVDSAVYGYVGISLERAGGVISVPLAAAA